MQKLLLEGAKDQACHLHVAADTSLMVRRHADGLTLCPVTTGNRPSRSRVDLGIKSPTTGLPGMSMMEQASDALTSSMLRQQREHQCKDGMHRACAMPARFV